MATDEPGLPTGAPSPRARLRVLLLVVAVMAVLTAGWPLLNAAVADRQKLAAGSLIRVGPGGRDSATIRIGPNWTLRPAETNPRQSYALQRGADLVSISYVTVLPGHRTAQIWPGMRRILLLSYPRGSLSRPVAVTSGQGLKGLTGTVTAPGRTGVVTMFVGPSGTFAIRMMALVPRQDAAAAVAARELFVRSLRFPAARR